MSEPALETCPGRGLDLPASDGATHPYIGASPSCWSVFGEVLAREYGDAAFMKVHQLTVDAVQHPGKPEPRAARAVWACWAEHRDRVAEVAEQARSRLAGR